MKSVPPLGGAYGLVFVFSVRAGPQGRLFDRGSSIFNGLYLLEGRRPRCEYTQMVTSDLARDRSRGGGNWRHNHREKVVQPWNLMTGRSGIKSSVFIMYIYLRDRCNNEI